MAVCFILTSLIGPGSAYAQTAPELPKPNELLAPSADFTPVILKGMVIHPEDPLKFDFLMDTGTEKPSGEILRQEAEKSIKYFLASLTVPEDDLWVNLSPYEKDRVIPDAFSRTVMGRDLLSEDYVLKQLASSLLYPEGELGKEFWDKIYSEAAKAGVTEIDVSQFNRVWIVPSEAQVWEHDGKVVILKSHLKVMLESDYMAAEKAQETQVSSGIQDELSKGIMRSILIPAIEREVNEGANFSRLRQVYAAMILSAWYKIRLKESLLGKAYADQNKVTGVEFTDGANKEDIYNQYLEAAKKGVYNYIREENDPLTGDTIPRKYFSGGFDSAMLNKVVSAGLLICTLAELAPEAQVLAQQTAQGQSVLVSAGVQQVSQDSYSAIQKMQNSDLHPAGLSDLGSDRYIDSYLRWLGGMPFRLEWPTGTIITSTVVWESLRLRYSEEDVFNKLKQRLTVNQKDEEVLKGAAWVMGVSGSERALNFLMNLRKEPIGGFGGMAINEAVGYLRLKTFTSSRPSAQSLMIMANGSDKREAVQALLSLGEIGGKEAESFLASFISNEKDIVAARNRASKKVRGEYPDTADLIYDLKQKMPYDSKIFFDASLEALLLEFGNRNDKTVVELLSEDPVFVDLFMQLVSTSPGYPAAALVLGVLKKDRAVPVLIKALEKGSELMRINAAVALGEINDRRAESFLLKALYDKRSADTRMAAARALGKMQSDEAIGPLLNLYTLPEWKQYDLDYETTIRHALLAIDNKKVAKELIARLDKYTSVSLGLLEQLDQGVLIILDDPDFFNKLIGLLDDRRYAKSAANIIIKHGNRTLNAQLIEKMLSLLYDSDEVTRSIALQALNDINDERVQASAIVDAIERSGGYSGVYINKPSIVKEMLSRLKYSKGIVRDNYRVYIGHYVKRPGPELIDLLLSTMEDADEIVRQYVVYILGTTMDERATFALIKALGDKKWFIRMGAAEALRGRDDNLDVIKALVGALHDKKGLVRLQAALSLLDQDNTGGREGKTIIREAIQKFSNTTDRKGSRDHAMSDGYNTLKKTLESRSQHIGGIDLDAKKLNLQIKRDGKGVPLPVDQQDWSKINIQGFIPVIYKIEPVDMGVILGLNNEGQPAAGESASAFPVGKELEPVGT